MMIQAMLNHTVLLYACFCLPSFPQMASMLLVEQAIKVERFPQFIYSFTKASIVNNKYNPPERTSSLRLAMLAFVSSITSTHFLSCSTNRIIYAWLIYFEAWLPQASGKPCKAKIRFDSQLGHPY